MRRSLREAFEQFAVLFDDPPQSLFELGVLAPALDRIGKRPLDGLVETDAVGARDRFRVGRELIVETHREVLRHDVMVATQRERRQRRDSRHT